MRRLLIPLAATWAVSCGPSVDLPDGGFNFLPDRQLDPPPGPPQVDPLPAVTPYEILTIRGRAEGRRVFITPQRVIDANTFVGINPVAVTIGISGEFCADVRLPQEGSYAIGMQAYSNDNQIGDPLPQKLSVRYDTAAPDPMNLLTCGGVHPSGCVGQVEICTDGLDNDCNGLRDEQDPACQPCEDDALEENDDTNAPRIQPGSYRDLQICANDPDYYGIFLRAGEQLNTQIQFAHAEGDLDLDLLGLDLDTVLRRSATLDDDEAFSWTATASGVHMVRVFGSETTANGYTLVMDVQGN